MNKSDLVNHISSKSQLTKADSARAIDAILNSITTGLKQGQEIRLVGFGTFSVAQRKATEGHNPRTGDKLKIPARKQPKFRPGKALKESVSKK